MFKQYIDKWSKNKIESKDINPSLYEISKHFLNNLYGKFGTNPVRKKKLPYYNYEEGTLKYKLSEPEHCEPVFIALACFVTAWSRHITLTTAQKHYKEFIYSDTDSLHLCGRTIPNTLKIDDYKLGFWSWEMAGWKAKYIGAKTYLQYGRKPTFKYKDNKKRVYKKVVVAGMPQACHKHVNIDNFNVGMVYPDKNKSKRVPGGVIIFLDYHTLKER